MAYEDKAFSWSRQSSEKPINQILRTNDIINVESDAIKTEIELGFQYIVDGSFINFTKKNEPELTLCLTKAQLF